MRSVRGLARSIPARAPFLIKELSGFGVVGAVCFVIDVGLFQLLYAHAHVDAVAAKVASTLVTMTLAYLGHRFWSFSHREHARPARQYVMFALINGFTLLLGAAIVWFVRYPLGRTSVLDVQIANVVSIGLGSLLRYLGYRRWVFTAQGSSLVGRDPDEDAEPPATRAAA